ncbi:hypothetical protein NDI85_06140 [Halomicroarcula sp. S1AR25-4]|uniref:hypothetical protein n=1 Tax=Haloarcula sp. S1AR25-4 TaxID=2950538 RepID=UPI002876E85F|nr:hypothetical protein [Halomicroarcula sp. S1AR25-4]MDS0277366.1 hypothetical protein [Halomicroarcula sp. S1AR25-4]
MTVYFGTDEVDVLGAHLEENRENPDEATMKVWFAYRDADHDLNHGVHTASISDFRVKGGLKHLTHDVLSDLPDSRIRGDHPWAKQARGDADGE